MPTFDPAGPHFMVCRGVARSGRALCAALSLCAAVPAAAQEPPPGAPTRSEPGATPADVPPPAPPPETDAPATPYPYPPDPGAPPGPPPETAAPPAATPSAPAPPPAAAIPASPAAPPPPGEADRAQAARALERTLVQRGGLLLEPGRFEVVPEVSYASADEPIVQEGGTIAPSELRVLTGSLTLRLGLPLRLQLEGEAPWVLSQHTPATGSSATATALGDVRAGATLHVVRAAGWFPDVLVGGFWKSRTGRSALDDPPERVPTGTGIEQLGGSVSLVKPLEPVVLLVSAEVTESVPRKLEAGWLDLRAAVGITTSVLLAVSPDTSLAFGVEQGYSQFARLAGRGLPGTNRSEATLVLGFATVVSRAALLEVRLGVGLTDDVPRFALAVALPLQF